MSNALRRPKVLFCKVPRFFSLVHLITATLRRRSIWDTGGIKLTEPTFYIFSSYLAENRMLPFGRPIAESCTKKQSQLIIILTHNT